MGENMNHALIRRRDAAQATLDRYKGTPFRFCSNDCVRFTAFHLEQLGYEAPIGGISYSTAAGALRALRKRGFASLPDAVDSIGLQRIAPAAAIVGDIVCAESDDGVGGLGVVLGNGAVLAFHQDLECADTLRMGPVTLAWRVDPR